MIKLSVKSVTGLFLVSGFTVAGLYGVSNMNREVTPYEINSQPAFHYNQNELVESLDALVNDSNATAENTEVAKTKVADAKKAQEKTEAATQKFKKAEEAKNSALNEAKNAEETVKKVSVAKKEAEEELKKATNAEEKAKAEAKVKALEEEAKKAEEARIAAQEKARLAEEEARIAEEAKKAAEEEKLRKEAEAKQAIEEARKKIEETSKQEPAELPQQETTKQPEEKVTNINSTNNTSSTVKNSSSSTKESPISADTITSIKNAINKTIEAKSLTVRNINEKWTKEYDNNNGTELIVYHSGSTIADTAGILYSYRPSNSATTKSLFKQMSTSIWTVPSGSDIKDASNAWSVQFSGTRKVGVIELELVKNLRFLINATPLTNENLKGSAYKDMGSDIKFYRVAVSNTTFNNWLSNYYGDTAATDTVMIDIGINSDNYVCYLKGRVLGDKKTRSFEIVLANANTTHVPTASTLGLSDEVVSKLEEEYRAKQDCEREGDHWVCGPHKHVNQYKF